MAMEQEESVKTYQATAVTLNTATKIVEECGHL